ncbi:MAG TPA: exodeoxyribonuclease VII small subunit [Legionellales bacterium]|jgi:exodeoxyribonuclease VII small subunit|nr:exodeoxyribonuclease VII small subunit [Legionellales bacterium]
MTSAKNFEQSITELEKIVESLEQGDLPLEETLKKFEEGMKLSQYCQTALNEAQNKINQLMKDSNNDNTSNDNP